MQVTGTQENARQARNRESDRELQRRDTQPHVPSKGPLTECRNFGELLGSTV